MAVQGAFWLAKRYTSTLISVFLTGFRYFSYQIANQLPSRGWVDPIPDPILRDRFLGYRPGIEPGTSWITVRRANYYTKQVVERTYMYEILITGPLCTTECAGESRFSANLCKRALDVTIEATRNANILTINASEDFQ